MPTLTANPADVNTDPADVEPTAPYTEEDARWWAEETRDDSEPDWDTLAEEADAQARLEMGCLL